MRPDERLKVRGRETVDRVAEVQGFQLPKVGEEAELLRLEDVGGVWCCIFHSLRCCDAQGIDLIMAEGGTKGEMSASAPSLARFRRRSRFAIFHSKPGALQWI